MIGDKKRKKSIDLSDPQKNLILGTIPLNFKLLFLHRFRNFATFFIFILYRHQYVCNNWYTIIFDEKI